MPKKSKTGKRHSPKRKWKRRGPGRPPASAAGKRGGLTLMTPAGFRIEGISSQELIRLLKALG